MKTTRLTQGGFSPAPDKPSVAGETRQLLIFVQCLSWVGTGRKGVEATNVRCRASDRASADGRNRNDCFRDKAAGSCHSSRLVEAGRTSRIKLRVRETKMVYFSYAFCKVTGAGSPRPDTHTGH